MHHAGTADANEVVLVDEAGNMEEGMSSNFFAVQGGTVLTADEGVLKGTVREIVLRVCVCVLGGVGEGVC